MPCHLLATGLPEASFNSTCPNLPGGFVLLSLCLPPQDPALASLQRTCPPRGETEARSNQQDEHRSMTEAGQHFVFLPSTPGHSNGCGSCKEPGIFAPMCYKAKMHKLHSQRATELGMVDLGFHPPMEKNFCGFKPPSFHLLV